MQCKLCGQRGVDGAIDQYGDFICVDCFAEGEAAFAGRKAQIMAPTPDIFGSIAYADRLDHNKIKDAWNRR